MHPIEPVLNIDDLRVETIGVIPAVNPEDLTQGYGLTELEASCNTCQCWASCVAMD